MPLFGTIDLGIMNTQKKTRYYIDRIAISQEIFDRFLATLTEVEKTWYCKVTQYG